MNINQQNDSKKYRDRNNLEISNANLYISNNNNPFLVSPYSYPTNLAKKAEVQTISTIISSLIGDLSSIINLSTFTLSISTITNIPSSDSVTISTTSLLLDTASTYLTGDLTVDGNSFFTSLSSLYGNFSTINSINISSLYGNYSSIDSGFINTDINICNFLTVNSTINSSTINTGNINFSTLFGSTINTGNINFSTLIGSTVNTNTMTINNNLVVSSINATSSITTQELIFSSLCMIPSTISSGVTTFNSSILICLNGSYWKIPIEPL
jgi:hypothetical protein